MEFFSTNPSKLSWFRYILLIGIPLIAAVFVVWKFFLVVGAPFRLDYAEGFVFFNTSAVLHGNAIYHAVDSPPFVFGFYTPLYYYLSAVVMKFVGVSVSVTRTLSFLFFMGSAVLLGAIVQRFTARRKIAFLAALLFVSSFVISQWSAIARPDMLSVFFIILGVLIGVLQTRLTTKQLFLTAVVFALAFFTKQHFVFAQIAYALWLIFRDKRNACKFIVFYAASIAVGVLTLHIFTDGYFTKQIFIYTSHVDYTTLYPAFRIAVITGISTLPLLFIAARNVFKKPKNFFSIYVLVSLLGFPMLLREGGIQNYLLEFFIALILVASIGAPWGWLHKLTPRKAIPLLCVAAGFFVLWSYAAMPWETKIFIDERGGLFTRENEITSPDTETILAEDPLLFVGTEQTPLIEPFTFGQLARKNVVSTNQLFADMKKGTYTFVVDYGAFAGIPGFEDALHESYVSLLPLVTETPVKPFDYSLYNKNTFTEFGNIYIFPE